MIPDDMIQTAVPASRTPLVEISEMPQLFWDTSSDFFILTDDAGVLTATNPAWCRALGWTASGHPHVRVRDLVHEADRPAAREALGKAESGQRFEGVELRVRSTEGVYRVISWSGVTDGRFWYATGRDVSDVRRAESVARESTRFWQATIDSIQGEVALLDDGGHIVAVNEAWRNYGRRHGRTTPADLGTSYLDICDRAGREPGARKAAEAIRNLLGGSREPESFDYALGNQWYTFTASVFVGGRTARVVIAHTDVTERRRLEEESRATSAALDQLEVAVVGADEEGRITSWSPGAERLYGWSDVEVLGRTVDEMLNPRPLAVSDAQSPAMDGRYEVAHKDGSTFTAHARWTELHDSEGQPAGSIGIAMDVSAQHRAEVQTGSARDRLRAVTDSMSEGLLALDPDGGVTLMNQAAESMLGWSLHEISGQRLHDITRHRRSDGLHHGSKECPVGGAAGLAGVIQVEDDVFIRRDGLELAVLYTVTPLGTTTGVDGCVVVFMDATHVRAEQERAQKELDAVVWIQRVEAAREEDRFRLYAQPIVDLTTMAVTQHELLLRVLEKDGTISPPSEYIATAEEFGLIGDIDRWVIRSAIDLAASGRAVEVNVSAASVCDIAILDEIELWLITSGVDPALLVFEITETAIIANEQAGRRFVERIHEFGCKVALDDFGTGYSGFAYLKQLPVDYLKIDIEFVRDLCHDSGSRHVVEAVVKMARGFGLKTVAEGVEDAETLDLLIGLGVDYAQGYHLGRPAPFLPPIAP